MRYPAEQTGTLWHSCLHSIHSGMCQQYNKTNCREKTMNRKQNLKTIFTTTLIFSFFLFIPSFSFAVTDTEAMSVNQTILMAQGKVKSFDNEKQLLLIKTTKGERVTITLDWNTDLIGYSSLQEIKKEQGVKIWYSVEADKKTATKIERRLEVGC